MALSPPQTKYGNNNNNEINNCNNNKDDENAFVKFIMQEDSFHYRLPVLYLR